MLIEGGGGGGGRKKGSACPAVRVAICPAEAIYFYVLSPPPLRYFLNDLKIKIKIKCECAHQ